MEESEPVHRLEFCQYELLESLRVTTHLFPTVKTEQRVQERLLPRHGKVRAQPHQVALLEASE